MPSMSIHSMSLNLQLEVNYRSLACPLKVDSQNYFLDALNCNFDKSLIMLMNYKFYLFFCFFFFFPPPPTPPPAKYFGSV